ncbi:hypothetical protein HRR83_005748 [Exophiala dermatitidis]|uniref:Transmembrane protein n=1 Tax=Exophiala dermatitidis TaxID=5970 RepID=A0AAN6EN16_EXODE|nr:hypothetical protein HRR73_007323 [Exophiala dermatitidis]KAJ4513304.1 hypothetical protein HRR74_006116 [Exophiala dermatitidis]KAJ4538145.1 hypothetical protein HRR77_007185 [Exophiala dermatitidis]KAJ4539880.1 hypothetical protein HRR76_003311 [Exophiala dermatitidis]KAJ4562437.1 hypothetical protein HRR79_006763 [Exophiala dermatitidis]
MRWRFWTSEMAVLEGRKRPSFFYGFKRHTTTMDHAMIAHRYSDLLLCFAFLLLLISAFSSRKFVFWRGRGRSDEDLASRLTPSAQVSLVHVFERTCFLFEFLGSSCFSA